VPVEIEAVGDAGLGEVGEPHAPDDVDLGPLQHVLRALEVGQGVGRAHHSGVGGGAGGVRRRRLALGVGIAAFASLSHRLFGGENFTVWIIETANDAINLSIAGALIAYFNGA
jgi:hypothetical protein